MQTRRRSDQVPPMVPVGAGWIAIKDEGTGVSWTVRVDPFELAAWPVTNGLMAEASDPQQPTGASPHDPATDVSWIDAIRFCNRLSQRQGLEPCYTLGDDRDALTVAWDRSASGFRLPTGSRMGVRMPCGKLGHSVRAARRDRVVRRQLGRARPTRRDATSEPMGPVRHDRQRVGVVLGPLRPRSIRPVPRVSRRGMERLPAKLSSVVPSEESSDASARRPRLPVGALDTNR